MASFKLAKLAIFAVLLISATAPSFGSKVYTVIEEEAEVTKMGKFVNGKLSCADIGAYCNTLFGPNCCDATCVQGPLVGGVCVRRWST